MSARLHRAPSSASLLLLLACGGTGGGGDPGAGPAPPPSTPVPPSISLQTTVGLNALGYQLPTLTNCLSASDGLALPALGPDFRADGDLAEWARVPTYLDDPAGDAPAGFDLAGVAVAQAGESVAIAAPIRLGDGASLNFEWGGIVAQKGQLRAEVRRILRVYQGVLEDFDNGAWRPVSADLGQLGAAAGGTEVALSRRLLGDVVTWPLWWVRVFTRDEARAVVVDSTSAAYFPSVLGADHPAFTVSGCELWAGRRVPVGFLEARDAAGPAPGAKASAGADWGAVTDQAFQLARATYNAVQETLGAVPMPVARIAVLATANDLTDLVDGTGVGAAYLGPAPLYRAVMLDVKALAPPSTAGFPEGEVIDRTASALFDLYLQGQFPGAPPALVHAARRALLDHMDQKMLSIAYFLDNLPFDAAPLLAGPVAAGALTEAKAVGFGHLLGSLLAPPPLLVAWRRAGALAGAADPALALRDALVAGAGADTALAGRLARLWQGWATAEGFDPAYAPVVLADAAGGGLPRFLAAKYGTDPVKIDSNGDGWSDAAKVALGIDPLTGGPPNVIVPDNDFGDWQTLMPKKLVPGKGLANGKCPKAATIGFYAAIANHDTLMIGAYAADYLADEPSARWEAEFDFVAEKRHVLLTAEGGGHSYELRDATTKAVLKSYRRAAAFGQRTFKVAVGRQALGLATNLDAPAAVKVQMRTVFTGKDGDHFCDQTDWISPYMTTD